MRERPILFSGPMVRAILDGTKTQTRRVVKPQPVPVGAIADEDFGAHRQTFVERGVLRVAARYGSHPAPCPYGEPGDRLWVRETWAQEDARDLGLGASQTLYRATATDAEAALVQRWRPSIHMPRWASRLTLEVTSVRVERLQDITEDDARAEGAQERTGTPSPGSLTRWARWSMDRPHPIDVDPLRGHEQCLGTARHAFGNLIERINGIGTWDVNPWVWVVGFKRVEVRHG